jgi:hypothetical protein
MDSVTTIPARGDGMAIRTDSSLWTWGYNGSGQLGNGSIDSGSWTPVKIMDNVVSIAAGLQHKMAVKTDGSLWTWGSNVFFDLGIGPDLRGSLRPIPAKIMDSVKSVSAGQYGSMAITTDNSLWVWGGGFRYDESYSLTLSDVYYSNITEPEKIMESVMAAATWQNHHIVITTDGSLWTWGDNSYGQLGNGTTVDEPSPKKLAISTASLSSPPPTSTSVSNNPSSWAVAEVNRAIAANIVPQSLQSAYTQPITRAEFCALVVPLYETVSGLTITGRLARDHSGRYWFASSSLPTFSDTNDINVQKAAAIGVVQGVGNDMFDPNSRLTREQAATMLSRLKDLLDEPEYEMVNGVETRHISGTYFSDLELVSSWALSEVILMWGAGIMHGVGENTFAPREPYTREQSIMTIMRLYDVLD